MGLASTVSFSMKGACVGECLMQMGACGNGDERHDLCGGEEGCDGIGPGSVCYFDFGLGEDNRGVKDEGCLPMVDYRRGSQ